MDKYKNAIGIIKACGLNIKGSKELKEQAKQIENTIIEALEKVQKQAEWVFVEQDENDMTMYRCSNCGRKQYGASFYCATCGAEMNCERLESEVQGE